MIKVQSEDKYNTSFGLAFVIYDVGERFSIGQKIQIDGNEHIIKDIILPSEPNNNKIALIV